MSDRSDRKRERRRDEELQAQQETAILPGMSDQEIEARIRQRVQRWLNKRREFMGHLISYLGVNALLWGIWLFSSSHEGSGPPWPIWVSFFWGLGLLGHFIDTYQHSPGVQARAEMTIQREVEREKMRLGISSNGDYEKPKRSLPVQEARDYTESPAQPSRPMRLSDDGELVPVDDEADQKAARRMQRGE